MTDAIHPKPTQKRTVALGVPLALLGALSFASIVYRWRLASHLAASAADLGPEAALPPGTALAEVWTDVAVAIGLTSCALLVRVILRDPLASRVGDVLRAGGFAFVALLLIALGMVTETQLQLLCSLQTSFGWDLLQETLRDGDPTEIARQATASTWLFAGLPALAFVALSLAGRVNVRVRDLGAVALACALTVTAVLAPHGPAAGLPVGATRAPVWHFVSDALAHVQARPSDAGGALLSGDHGDGPPEQEGVTADDEPLPGSPTGEEDQLTGAPSLDGRRPSDGAVAQESSFRYVDPRVVYTDRNPKKALPARAERPWNVVWIIMESTGLRYVMGKDSKGVTPMPFLRALADRSWFLTNHYSNSNSSARGIFAQLAGLNPRPTVAMWVNQKDIYVPSLATLLGTSYDRFLVTPGRLTYYFPRAFLEHSGLDEMHGFLEVPVTKDLAGEGIAKEETGTVDFFLDRMERAKPPFFATYYSFVPHWPYTDYGPRWRRFPGGRAIDRYHNNLAMLDAQIARIYAAVERRGLLDTTVFVFAGDHGEAFGQHEHNWAHAQHSFNENYQTPAILHQPALFAPRVVTERTSHVDLLPTLLDAMGVSYDEALLQGESLFQDVLRRKYVFLFGKEGTATAISEAGIKLQYNLKDKQCWAFDLVADPGERRRLGCERHGEQASTLRWYVSWQRRMLREYNTAARDGQPFRGHAHVARPTPVPATTGQVEPTVPASGEAAGTFPASTQSTN